MKETEQEREQIRQVLEKVEPVGVEQLSLIYGGLIVIGVYMVTPFLTASSLDLSARVSVVAFSVAIPLLATLVLINQLEVVRRHVNKVRFVEATRVVGQTYAAVGVVAGFWHITWMAGVGMLTGLLVGVAVLSAGYSRLGRDQQPTPPEDDEPGDAEL